MEGLHRAELIKCFKEFAKYASFNVMGMIGLSCYILADTYFVAKGLGANGLAALNIAIPIYSFIYGFGMMFSIGGATKYTILKSKGEHHKANGIFTNTLIATLGMAVVFFIIGLFGSGFLAQTMGAQGVVFQMSKTYMQVILLFSPIFMLNNVLLSFVRNDGAPHLSMLAMIGGSMSNILLDYIFIFPLDMGIFGAVLATGFAPVISILIMSPYFMKKQHDFHLIRHAASLPFIQQIISSGLPSFITEVSSGTVIIVFNMIILRLQGNIGVAAYGVIANISLVVLSIYTGIAGGIQPIISKHHGMGNRTHIKAVLGYGLITVIVLSGIIYASVWIGASPIATIFNSEQNTLLQNLAVSGLRIYFVGCVFAGLNIVLSVYFTSTEHPRPAHMISMLRGFVLIIPLAFILSALGGMTGIWVVFPATEVIVCAISLYVTVQQRCKV